MLTSSALSGRTTSAASVRTFELKRVVYCLNLGASEQGVLSAWWFFQDRKSCGETGSRRAKPNQVTREGHQPLSGRDEDLAIDSLTEGGDF